MLEILESIKEVRLELERLSGESPVDFEKIRDCHSRLINLYACLNIETLLERVAS